MKSSTAWLLGLGAIVAGIWWLSKSGTAIAATNIQPNLPAPQQAPPIDIAGVPVNSSGMQPINYTTDPLTLTDVTNGAFSTDFMGAGYTNPTLQVTDLLGNPLGQGQ